MLVLSRGSGHRIGKLAICLRDRCTVTGLSCARIPSIEMSEFRAIALLSGGVASEFHHQLVE